MVFHYKPSILGCFPIFGNTHIECGIECSPFIPCWMYTQDPCYVTWPANSWGCGLPPPLPKQQQGFLLELLQVEQVPPGWISWITWKPTNWCNTMVVLEKKRPFALDLATLSSRFYVLYAVTLSSSSEKFFSLWEGYGHQHFAFVAPKMPQHPIFSPPQLQHGAIRFFASHSYLANTSSKLIQKKQMTSVETFNETKQNALFSPQKKGMKGDSGNIWKFWYDPKKPTHMTRWPCCPSGSLH